MAWLARPSGCAGCRSAFAFAAEHLIVQTLAHPTSNYAPDPKSCTQVGSYSVRVEALLAEGGFATVYRVQDVTTQKVQQLGGPACRRRD